MPTEVIAHDKHGDPVGINGKRSERTAAEAVARRTGMDAFEPTLGVSKEGSIYFQAAQRVDEIGGNFRFEPHVLRTDDRGRTWRDVSPQVAGGNVHVYTGDPYLHLDPDTQRVFTVDWIFASYCSQLSFSDDGGESWSSTIFDCGGFDHQNVFTGPPSITTAVAYPNLVYYCGQAIPSAVCSKSVDGGRSFLPTGAAPFADISDVLDCGRSTGHGTVGPTGIVYLPTACDKPYLAVSTDEGASWKVVAVSDKGTNGYHETAVGADDEGNVYYAWIGDDRLPYISVSRDGGESWGETIRVGPGRLKEANLPALAVSSEGTVAVAYMGTTDVSAESKDYDGVAWKAFITMTTDLLKKKPLFHTAVFGNTKDPLVIGECGPGRCQVEYDFIDVQIDEEQTAWVSFVDGCEGEKCSDTGEGVIGSLRSIEPAS